MVAEAPWPCGARGLGQAARVAGIVGALAVTLQLLEDLRERALAQLARPARRDLQPPATPLHEARVLQHAFDLLEPSQVLRGRIAQGAAHGFLVDVVERGPRVVALHRTIELLIVVQPLHRVDGGRHRHALPVAEALALTLRPTPCRGTRPQVRAQAIDLEGEVHVLHDLFGEFGELRSLLGRERGHQAAHRGHAPCHLLQQLVERRRSVGEEVAVARHEVVEGRLRVVASRRASR